MGYACTSAVCVRICCQLFCMEANDLLVSVRLGWHAFVWMSALDDMTWFIWAFVSSQKGLQASWQTATHERSWREPCAGSNTNCSAYGCAGCRTTSCLAHQHVSSIVSTSTKDGSSCQEVFSGLPAGGWSVAHKEAVVSGSAQPWGWNCQLESAL